MHGQKKHQVIRSLYHSMLFPYCIFQMKT